MADSIRRLRLLNLVFFGLLMVSTRLFACDTNLFAIIGGDSKETAFIEASTKLTVAAKELNENAKKPEAFQKLNELMDKWLDFSSHYVVFPPEWGKNDENWKLKFSDLARILGEIRKHLGNNYPKAHSEILRFSRRLSKLYEKMSKTQDAALLLNLTWGIDKLWIFIENGDCKGVNAFSRELYNKMPAFRKVFGENHEDKIDDIEFRLKNIVEYSESEEKFATFHLNILLTKLEDDLTELDKEISELRLSKNEKQGSKL